MGAGYGVHANQGFLLDHIHALSWRARYAEQAQFHIVLTDCTQLAQPTIRLGVGTQVKQAFRIVEINENYFG